YKTLEFLYQYPLDPKIRQLVNYDNICICIVTMTFNSNEVKNPKYHFIPNSPGTSELIYRSQHIYLDYYRLYYQTKTLFMNYYHGKDDECISKYNLVKLNNTSLFNLLKSASLN